MLRYLYRFVVRAHPGSFRRRFGDEMLSIFDQSEGKLSHASLLLDGVLSLFRQWALRPDLEQERCAVDGGWRSPFLQVREGQTARCRSRLWSLAIGVGLEWGLLDNGLRLEPSYLYGVATASDRSAAGVEFATKFSWRR